MQQTEIYNVHDFLTIRTNASIPIPSYFAGEEAKTNRTIEIEERESFDPHVPSYARRLASHHYWYKDDSLIVRYPSTPFGGPIAVRISGIAEDVTQLVYSPAFRKNSDFNGLLEGILTRKLLEAGVALIHAGAVVDGDEATVLASMGRMGKTSTLLSLLRDDSELGFMGDNILLLHSSGRVYSWPTTLGVFPGTAVANEQLSEKTRLRVQIKRLVGKSDLVSAALLHKFSIDLSENLLPESVASSLVDSASISQIYILNGGRVEEGSCDLSPTEASAKIATGTDMELDPQNYHLSLCAFAGGIEEVHPSVVKEQRREVILNGLVGIDVTELFANHVEGYINHI